MKLNMERTKELIRKNFKWIVLFICLIGFIALAEDVFNKEIMKGDIIGYHLISTYFIADHITPIAKIITNFGGAIFLISLTVILLLVIKNKKIGISIIANLLIATILNFLLKNILQRPRPTEYRLIDESGYSFPSGHSMVSMAFYGFLIYLIYKNIKNKKIKWGLINVLSVLIIAIGVSRVYLGVHYTSDVLAGFLIAIFYLILYTSIVKKYILEGEKNEFTTKKKNESENKEIN